VAELHLLYSFDYRSTVSGGGYIGAWLANLIKKEDGRASRSGRGVHVAESSLNPESNANRADKEWWPILFLQPGPTISLPR
jgi:hypothetical protein